MSRTAEEHVRLALEYRERGDLPATMIELQNALQKQPDLAEARLLLGLAYLDAGMAPAAESELRRAEQLGAEGVTLPLATSLLQQGRYSILLSEISVATDASPEAAAELHSLRGQAHLGLQQVEEALNAFDLALEAKEDSAHARLGRAVYAMSQGQSEETRRWVTLALESDATYPEAWALLGDLEGFSGNAEEAERAFTEAIRHRGHHSHDLFKRALMRIHLGKFDEARRDIENLKRLAPQHPSGHFAEGLLSFHNKDYTDAQNAFNRALAIDPDYPAALLYVGAAHLATDNLRQAEQHLQRFMSRYPDSPRAAGLLAAVRVGLSDAERAKQLIERAHSQNPDNPLTLSILGNLYLAEGREEGQEFLRRAMLLDAETGGALARGTPMLLEAAANLSNPGDFPSSAEAEVDRDETRLIVGLMQNNRFDEALAAARTLQLEQPDSATPWNLIGGSYLGKGDLEQALSAFRRALELRPEDVTAAINLARIQVRREEVEEALPHYESVLRAYPEQLAVWQEYFALKVREGRIEEGVAFLEEARAAVPAALAPRLMLGRYYLNTGRGELALAALEEAEQHHPNEAALSALLSEAALANRQFGKALTHSMRLVELRPESGEAHYLLAKAQSDGGDPTAARESLVKALELQPDHLAARVALLRLNAQENRMSEARVMLAKLKELHPDDPEVAAQTGWLALRENRFEEAVAALEDAFRRAPTAQLALDLSTARLRSEDRPGAVRTLEQWIAANPRDVTVRAALAGVNLLHGEHAAAAEGYREILQLTPDDVVALNNLAYLERESRPRESLQHAERALQLAPASAAVMDTLGIVLMELGEDQRAVSVLGDAVERAPANPWYRFHFAQALARTGDQQRARTILEALESEEFPERELAVELLRSLGESGGR